MNKVVSWDSEPEEERRATAQISHLAPGTPRNQRAGGHGGIGSQALTGDLPGAWAMGCRGWGCAKMGREDASNILLF